MENWLYFVLFTGTLGASLLGLWLPRRNDKTMELWLAWSGAYLFGIVLTHILPDTYALGNGHTGLWILAGFLLQLGLESLSRGVEHGHVHHEGHNTHKQLAWTVFIGLSVHSVLEGMPLEGYDLLHAHHAHGHDHGHAHGSHDNHTQELLYGIMLHKVPAAFTLAVLLTQTTLKRVWTFMLLIAFAAMTPLGAGLVQVLHQSNILSASNLQIIMALVTGSFLHVSTALLFTNEQHQIRWRKLLVIISGFVLAAWSMGVFA